MDDDIFNFLNSLGSTTTVADNETETDEVPSQSTSYNPYVSSNTYDDDYSVTPNYTEQQSYNPTTTTFGGLDEEPKQTTVSRIMEMPTIKKDETPVVNLVKTKHRIALQARMKIVIAMFSVIMSLLLFVSVYNFASASKLKATFAGKETQIAVLQDSISKLSAEYNYFASDEGFDYLETTYGPNYVEITENNTMTVDLGEFHAEQVVEEKPSNWFNDVCDFFSRLFA